MDEAPGVFQITMEPTIMQDTTVVGEVEVLVRCPICYKEFANDRALQNHSRMDHFVFNSPTPLNNNEPIVRQKRFKCHTDIETVQKKTEEVISSLEPTNLRDLASKDVSYIILKADETAIPKKETRKYKPRKMKPRPEKKIQAIKGPFECLYVALYKQSSHTDGLCHSVFQSCCEYSTHFRDQHTLRSKGARCQVCEQPLPRTQETPLICEICNEVFYYEAELSSHTARTHVKARPYECDICNKRFTQQGALVQHKRIHTGDRPFPCPHCDRGFTQRSGLKQHMRQHTNERPFRCVVCHKTFAQAVNLKLHMRGHTNVAPFQCGICGKKYKQGSNLNYHLRNHDLKDLNKNVTSTLETVPTQYVDIDFDHNDTFMSTEERSEEVNNN